MVALVVLVAALGLCAALLLAAPSLAGGMAEALPLAQQHNAPLVDTLLSLSIFGTLIAIAMIGAALSGFNAARLGRRPAMNGLLGVALGTIGVAATAGYAGLAGTLGTAPASGSWPLLLWGSALILLETGAEEIYFRGWLQRVLADHWGAAIAVPVAAFAFAGLHILGGARNPVSIVNLFVAGLLFGLLALRSLAAAIAAHFAWNWCESIVLGLSPNPGLGDFGALANFELAGASIWGGSDEGLNGSIAMTITLLALVLAVVLLSRRRAAIAPPPARDRSGPVRP